MARYALVVGTAKYNPSFRNLDKAATDAAEIAQILQTHGQYQVEPLPKRLVEAENCWQLAPDKKLTGKDLGQALETFLLEQAKGQEALIYFAGHGFEVSGLGRKRKGYLATSDCTSTGSNGILFSDLNDLIRESKLSSLVLILDCCHAGSFLERTVLESTLTAFQEKKDYYMITACRAFERAREGEDHGVFTAAVLKGLQPDNADSEGAVTGDRLFDFIQRELRHSGQEPIRSTIGRSLTLVTYSFQGFSLPEIDENLIPYRGLEPFEKEQVKLFFGRRQVVEDIWKKLNGGNFVAVIGSSGSGKSSVVQAGLVPWLEEAGWQTLKPIKPGISPLTKLVTTFEPFFKDNRSQKQLDEFIHFHPTGLRQTAERLPSSTKFLLVIDQFEEVFTLSRTEEKQQLIDLLTEIAEKPHPQLAVVTTMRADFLEACLQYSTLAQLIQNHAIFMPPLRGANLEQAITEPAKQLGYSFEPGLLGEILQDVGQEAECLPLLQFALLELWERREQPNRQLMQATYREMGRVLGTLNRYAEQIYGQLSSLEQEWTKRLCLKLVRTGGDLKDTRQRQPKRKLLDLAADNLETQRVIESVLSNLVDGRLLVSGEEAGEAWIDLTHETLMESWERFHKWRQENRDLRRLLNRIEEAYQEWLDHKQNDEFLLMGGLLNQVLESWPDLESELNFQIRNFVLDSKNRENEKNTTLRLAAEILESSEDIEKAKAIAFKRAADNLENAYNRNTYQNLDEILKPHNKIEGERKHVTVMFADIHDYTKLIKSLKTEEIVEIFNEYFKSILNGISIYGGTLNQHIGDAIVGVYGAPLTLIHHEWQAIQTALAMCDWLTNLNGKRIAQNQIPIKMVIGINSGTVISNSIGSGDRIKLTATGDEVNLAAHLMETSKIYGTDILISENTYLPCKDRIYTRKLDCIKVKGKNKPVSIYELVGLKSKSIPQEKQDLIALYEKGLEFCKQRKFGSAIGKFGEVLELDKDDKAAKLYLDRCKVWLQEAPADDWDGSWTDPDPTTSRKW